MVTSHCLDCLSFRLHLLDTLFCGNITLFRLFGIPSTRFGHAILCSLIMEEIKYFISLISYLHPLDMLFCGNITLFRLFAILLDTLFYGNITLFRLFDIPSTPFGHAIVW